MKKIAVTMLMLFGVFGFAQNNWVADILQPSDLPQVCKTVYDAISRNQASPVVYDNLIVLGNNVIFQTPRGSAYSACKSSAERLQAIPQIPPIALIFASGQVRELADANRWAAAIVLFDAAGNEIARQPYNADESQIGSTRRWNSNCSGGRCNWIGSNIFYFTFSPEFVSKLPQAQSFGYLLSRGSGIETIKIDRATAPNLK